MIFPLLNARHGHDNGLIELTLQPHLETLQVQKPEKAASETLAEGYGRMRSLPAESEVFVEEEKWIVYRVTVA